MFSVVPTWQNARHDTAGHAAGQSYEAFLVLRFKPSSLRVRTSSTPSIPLEMNNVVYIVKLVYIHATIHSRADLLSHKEPHTAAVPTNYKPTRSYAQME